MHLSIGQEAVAAGVCGLLRDDDPVYSGHRAHGHALAKGAPPGARAGGADGARRRPLPRPRRLDAPRRRRARVPRRDRRRRRQRPARARQRTRRPAPGRRSGRGRLLRRRRGPERPLRRVRQPGRAVAAAGDPRLREQRLRRVHPALGAHDRRARERCRSRRTDVERETVDGNDAVAVRAAFARLLATARRGEGPFLLECLTHRLRGHYEGDPQRYREALQPRTGRSSTRSCVCSGAESPRAGSSATRRRASSGRLATRSRRRCASRARARSRRRL